MTVTKTKSLSPQQTTEAPAQPAPVSLVSTTNSIQEDVSQKPTTPVRQKRKRPTKLATTTIAESPDNVATGTGGTTKRQQLQQQIDDHALVRTLQLVDPILQFLTRATGQTMVPWKVFKATLPKQVSLDNLHQLHSHGILHLHNVAAAVVPQAAQEAVEPVEDATTTEKANDQDVVGANADATPDDDGKIGFPSPYNASTPTPSANHVPTNLHASTKAAAKRRMSALRKLLAQELRPKKATAKSAVNDDDEDEQQFATPQKKKDWSNLPSSDDVVLNVEEEVIHSEAHRARQAFMTCFQFGTTNNSKPSELLEESKIPTRILPKQLVYAGSHAEQISQYAELSDITLGKLPVVLMDAFQLEHPHDITEPAEPSQKRSLYTHQVQAIESALSNTHTLVCTGTGSGKSLCFLLPVLAAAFNDNSTSLIIFPTKALAQDQLSKLTALLEHHHDLSQRIRPATLDGDTPHSQRMHISETANIILTNPDTLHANILPQWQYQYQSMLSTLRYLVIDEAHLYEGVFGAHVAMVLSRLARIAALAAGNADRSPVPPTILACSATLPHPEHHIRLLCPIAKTDTVTIIHQDGSPRSTKHFFVWNPPILDMHGKSTQKVVFPKPRNDGKKGKSKMDLIRSTKGQNVVPTAIAPVVELNGVNQAICGPIGTSGGKNNHGKNTIVSFRRRHSADETALLLARAVTQGVRCIAFCKSRSLVEWVYERAIATLKQNKSTADLADQVESYRGGYSREERRKIEAKLFQNQVLGVVATSALELGVDIGGLDLTLHCGYPSSYASLLQQAGRAGRGGVRMDVPSLAVVVCFNSPPDQHLWRHPTSLLSRSLSTPICMPIYPGLVQGHLLCAGLEFPLTVSNLTVANIQETGTGSTNCSSGPTLLPDQDLFGSAEVYTESLETLKMNGSVKEESIGIHNGSDPMLMRTQVYKTHGSIDKPCLKVSLRSIEPISYAIIDLSHPLQGNQMKGNFNEKAVMDHMPYSRIFYHAFPGAIIMHRGRRYKIVSVTRPPAFANDSGACHRSMTLAAYAKPSNHRYMTRPLSNLTITVTKQMERVDFHTLASTKVGETKPIPVQTTPIDPTGGVPDITQVYSEKAADPSIGSFAGCGIVNVKRTVHGYTKLSLVNREEISRTELSLPDMEYDSFAIWLDCEPGLLGPLLGNSYGYGVHALSHAILAVSPLFVSCVQSDVECDHSVYNPTRVTIFDARAGGSGICAQLWNAIFIPGGILEAAIDLMESCASCEADSGYEGGCPACLQSGNCIKFNDFLSKSAAITIGKRVLSRLQETEIFKANKLLAAKVARDVLPNATPDTPKTPGTPKTPDAKSTPMSKYTPPNSSSPPDIGSTRNARERAMRNAKDIMPSRDRQIVVGRPGWSMVESREYRTEDA